MKMKSVDTADIKKLMEDVALIKNVLSISKKDPEGELTEWAKNELDRARKEDVSKYTDLEDL